MRTLRTALVLSTLAVAGFFAPATKARADIAIDFDTYAAVAYSTSTGKYGYAWNCGTRGRAESLALANCKADDAKVVGWVKGGWLVLAIGDNNAYGVAWEYGDGASDGVAKTRAISECKKRADKVVTLVRLCSGNIDPQIIK